MRRQRRSLAPEARLAANRALVRNVRSLSQFRSARAIGVYFACDGEPALDALIAEASRRGKRLYAPVLSGGDMNFARLSPAVRLTTNAFGIAEPANSPLVDPRSLDLVLAPLVAFDAHGARLGFGGGYYDRCFRFLPARRVWFKPKLVGVGYAFQEIPYIEMRTWDVPLWGAVTENRIHRFRAC